MLLTIYLGFNDKKSLCFTIIINYYQDNFILILYINFSKIIFHSITKIIKL